MKILALGPYVGNFEQEVQNFRPYCRWVSDVVKYEDVYLCTHYNRFFLYDWIPEDHKIAVTEEITHDETSQIEHRSEHVGRNQFLKLRNWFKSKILEITDHKKQDITVHTIGYSKSSIPCPSHNKIYSRIEMDVSKGEHVYFVPSADQSLNLAIENILKPYEIRICDNNINNHDRYRYNIETMMSARFVVSELSYWTFLCNQNMIPVFSWGLDVGPYKKGGVMNMGNQDSMTVATSNKDSVSSMLKYFISKRRTA